ncbi:amidohydrolase [Chitinophaga nivalis]|uniref:Amidohydrolase n=1 Tax=Chitinophaga nivalis TaxID=2991709 RepID=A0ABT3IIA6_9BACT|nr:amidohydrolase [Chitinophaga nivalis]MCW3466615.1 amidohydrolase [Chitinophaga nivalis]MCW3483694.1 amidohydrolase [Chitinophaga nivalis]
MKKKRLLTLLPLGVLFIFITCHSSKDQKSAVQYPTVILKGKIRTMDNDADPLHTEQSIVFKGDSILFVGDSLTAIKDYYRAGSTIIHDYGDSLIMPGFIDAHAHVGLEALVQPLANLSGPPYGNVTTLDTLGKVLKEYAHTHFPGNKEAMLLGNNYDDSQLKSHKQPTQLELDAIDSEHPIYIMHVSGHMGVGNTKFLRMMGITNETPADKYPGGTIVKDHGINTGLLLENANIAAIDSAMSFSKKYNHATFDPIKLMRNAEDTCFSYGITTICEGRADANTYQMIKAAVEAGSLKGDYIMLPDFDDFRTTLASVKPYYNKYYKQHFKVGAIKFTFDGSPQGKDAYLSQPYHTPMIGQDSTYKGHPIYTYNNAYHFVDTVMSMGMPVHIHLNGDSAIDMALAIFNSFKAKKINYRQPTPNVFIHCQTAREDQLIKMKELGSDVMESFFPTHAYIWGDWYISNVLGNPRAQNISPLKHAENLGLRYTIHTDAPITPPDLITAVYAAVNRLTQMGVLLGPDQRISVYHALKAITTEAAYQWGEQDTKGKLKKGYKADIVVLTEAPMTIDSTKIRSNVHVVHTYKDGNLVYSNRHLSKKINSIILRNTALRT